MSNPKVWDEYEVKARYLPCFLSAVFPVHFAIQFFGVAFWDTIAQNVGWLVVANLSLSILVTLALIQLQCGIAKHWIEEGVFGKGGIGFPTTTYLLYKDAFLSCSGKQRIREKVAKDFNLHLLDEKDETSNFEEARKMAREAVSLIRRSVGKGVMTYHYNIRYGFMRNLIGGWLWGLAGSAGCAFLYLRGNGWKEAAFFIACAMTFLFLFLFRAKILFRYAHQYADTLFAEYISESGGKK